MARVKKIMEKTLQQILSEYEFRKNAAQKKCDMQTALLFAEHPYLQQFQEQKKELILQQLLEVMKAPQQKQKIVARFGVQLAELEAQMEDYLEKHNLHMPQIEVSCTLCGDSGYLIHGDKREFCNCLKERLYTEVLGAHKIESLKGSFEQFDESIFPEDVHSDGKPSQRRSMQMVRSLLQNYIAEFPENPQKRLLFMGTAGLGKSYCLACLCKELKKKQSDICYFGAYTLFRLFHRNRLGELDTTMLNYIYNVKVLVIDDLGNEPLTQNVSKEYFFDLLNYRLQKGLYTFISTNNTILQLEERYTGPVVSRLLSDRDTLTIRLSGKDLRLL